VQDRKYCKTEQSSTFNTQQIETRTLSVVKKNLHWLTIPNLSSEAKTLPQPQSLCSLTAPGMALERNKVARAKPPNTQKKGKNEQQERFICALKNRTSHPGKTENPAWRQRKLNIGCLLAIEKNIIRLVTRNLNM
jgi:hypothetical protein